MPPFNVAGVESRSTAPLKKLTVPVGVPLVVDATVAVSVRLVPEMGNVLLELSVVVVGACAIVTEPEPAPSTTV